MNIRKPAVAGTFYPEGKEELEQMLKGFFANVPESFEKRIPKALIVPHAGYVYSGQVAAYAYARLRDYKKIVLLGPSHHVYLDDAVTDTNNAWQTPLGITRVLSCDFEGNAEAHSQEHCLEVQIPFLQYALKHCEILPLVGGNIDIVEVSKKIQKILDPDTLLVISSDLSHYHDWRTAVKLDTQTLKAIQSLDAESMTEACGEAPIKVVIDIARTRDWKPEVLEYKNSGDVTGERSHVVGYTSVAFYDR